MLKPLQQKRLVKHPEAIMETRNPWQSREDTGFSPLHKRPAYLVFAYAGELLNGALVALSLGPHL